MEKPYDADVVVVGAGAIGTSAAMHLAREGLSVTVIEKEADPGLHQSGRNSGVIHAGYNPKPGSEKAFYCVQGNRDLREFCRAHGIPMTIGGIVVAACTEAEIATLEELERRAVANGTPVEMLDAADLRQAEPYAAGVAALQATEGGSFNARTYIHALESEAADHGTSFLYDRKVLAIEETGNDAEVVTDKGVLLGRVAINAAGLYADRLAAELSADLRVIPFRGYYAELKPNRTELIKSHLYRAPDLEFPFLGVHLSHRTDGRVLVGPGAMLAFGREAYRFSSFEGGGFGDTIGWPGFWRMLRLPAVRSLIKSEVTKSLSLKAIWREAQELVPSLEPEDLVRSFAGNRAQLVNRDGKLVDDIVVRESEHAIHVLNAVSPGLTCSLPFGKHLAEAAKTKL